MKINARKEGELVNPSTGQLMELDIYLPSLNLAFEYQVHTFLFHGQGALTINLSIGETSLHKRTIYLSQSTKYSRER